MKIEVLPMEFSVCKVADLSAACPDGGVCFTGRTDGENSLVCETENAPDAALAREDGWRAFRVAGELDFSLVGILARVASLLAGGGIPIFAVSTYNTDYILVKAENLPPALDLLRRDGWEVAG